MFFHAYGNIRNKPGSTKLSQVSQKGTVAYLRLVGIANGGGGGIELNPNKNTIDKK